MSKKSISFPEFPLVLNSYHDLSGIKESIMESIMSRNAHTLDVRSMNERGKHNLIDARTEKANNEKIMLSKQLEERIDNYLESTRENVINFYNLNINFKKKSFMYLAELHKMVNKFQVQQRTYPLLIGCGEHDIPMELKLIEMWKKREPYCRSVIFEEAGHCVNMDVPLAFNHVMEKFWEN